MEGETFKIAEAEEVVAEAEVTDLDVAMDTGGGEVTVVDEDVVMDLDVEEAMVEEEEEEEELHSEVAEAVRHRRFSREKNHSFTSHFIPAKTRTHHILYSPAGGVPAPDQTVTKTEDALLSGKGVDLSTLGLTEAFPRRPNYGTKGAEVVLWANYVAMTASPKLILYRYDISVSPAATGKKLTQIIRLVLGASELAAYQHDIVSDFKSTLISRQKFADVAITVPYRKEGEEEPLDNATKYNVKLQLTNTLATSELMSYLTSTDPSAQYDEKLPLIQAFNIFVNHYAKTSNNLATLGSAKVFSLGAEADTWDLGNCLTAMRGFFASVRAATARVLVNVNPTYAAFFQPGPLDQFIIQLGSFQNVYRQAAFINKLKVRTTHLKDKLDKQGKPIPRIKTIFGYATKNDGHGLEHPPRVKAFGSGPKDVEFWLGGSPQKGQSQSTSAPGGKKKGGKGGNPQNVAGSSAGQYISVYDFFVKSKWFMGLRQ